MDKLYWENYYRTNCTPFRPSDFAKYVIRCISPEDSVIDLGCGNGRDTVYLGSKGILTTGVDQCKFIIGSLNEHTYPNVTFQIGELGSLLDKHYTHAYARFSLHSLNNKEEDRLLKWV